jgi:aspartyl-tRNA(Asn)/glutamyl-tRNA(Gln) amidotransferase subunit C
MSKITREELLKIARLSHLAISESEITALLADIDNVLTYAARVGEVQVDVEPSAPLTNVFRDDVVISTDPQPLLAGAPERVEDYFVVPMILESNE